MKIAVIGRRSANVGFALAGIKDRFKVTGMDDAINAFFDCISDESIGIILIEDTIASYLEDQIKTVRRRRQPYPQILTFPAMQPDRGVNG